MDYSKAKNDTRYSYDPVGNLLNIYYDASPSVEYYHDAMNRVTNMTDSLGVTRYTYSSAGRLLTTDGPFDDDTLTNVYSNGLRVGLVLQQPTGIWTNAFYYDAAKRLTSVISPAGSFSYQLSATQPSTLIQKLTLPNTSYITNTFDANARLLSTTLKNSSHSTLNSHQYTYNSGNQRTQLTFPDSSTTDYTYDPIGQLRVANSSVNSEDRGYAYDAAWNMQYITNVTTPATFTVDGKNQLTATTDGANTYDDNGNLVSAADGFATYEYDDENRLVSVELTDYWLVCFYYDGLGRLAGREDYAASGANWVIQAVTIYIYDGMRVIQERAYPDTPTVSYTRGTDLSGTLEGAGGIGGLLARSHGYSSGNWTNHNYYHADGNGNITYLANNSQGLAASYRYDAYGNWTDMSGPLAWANTYRFSSKMIDEVTGMYYYGYRWYAPYWMRWLNSDPINEIGASLLDNRATFDVSEEKNLYAFVHNDALNSYDSFGLCCCLAKQDIGRLTVNANCAGQRMWVIDEYDGYPTGGASAGETASADGFIINGTMYKIDGSTCVTVDCSTGTPAILPCCVNLAAILLGSKCPYSVPSGTFGGSPIEPSPRLWGRPPIIR